ncbi:NRDE family protein [Pedobacter sp. Hv1]|uniref:NRDE family protein n=1 Tax=Pedobacter sp. Hv1 TaxID=1740090 RepID=UPI0006D8976C|nr:NRDE family protein [Pedobacter sp. Hv1]KQC00726.1 hypothetical protein AQF98_08585 [Pedobacter sp. Hv1]
MCTVTFIPVKNGYYITSNRDEQWTRANALAPQRYHMNGYDILFPKDTAKGGTWVALKENGDVAVLLNGAFVGHVALPPYAKSRGLILLEVLGHERPSTCFDHLNLEEIEPFTLILFTKGQLHEYRWDGKKKHQALLNNKIAHIWSSATLYTQKTMQERERWFINWQAANQQSIGTDSILNFHRFAGTGDQNNDLVMNRDGKIATVSITHIHLSKDNARMIYLDLKHQVPDLESLAINLKTNHKKNLFNKPLFSSFKKTMIKILNWEYWPLQLVYAPPMLYWFWLSLKARSLFFFSAANPLILNAGFALGRKSKIYELMPTKYYPNTLVCRTEAKTEELLNLCKMQNLGFPMIAKPDVGERGVQVKLLKTATELSLYQQQCKVDFLLQEFIDYEQEAGVFYYRIPGEGKGNISGIVSKEFLAVTGDGVSSIEMLLMKEDRFFLQLPILRNTYGKFLDQVLPVGKLQTLVPYGNHSRGAKFVDSSHMINTELVATIDQLCQKIPEFYFGRLDIKFKNWEDLSAGKNFSVIEVNGAASEPTHMYDPAHSIFFAWKEIIRHWQLLYQISKLNAERKGLSLMSTAEGVKMIRAHAQYLKILA